VEYDDRYIYYFNKNIKLKISQILEICEEKEENYGD
jgi:hypothetical protein